MCEGGGGGLGGYMSSNPVEPPHYDFPSYGPALILKYCTVINWQKNHCPYYRGGFVLCNANWDARLAKCPYFRGVD